MLGLKQGCMPKNSLIGALEVLKFVGVCGWACVCKPNLVNRFVVYLRPAIDTAVDVGE